MFHLKKGESISLPRGILGRILVVTRLLSVLPSFILWLSLWGTTHRISQSRWSYFEVAFLNGIFNVLLLKEIKMGVGMSIRFGWRNTFGHLALGQKVVCQKVAGLKVAIRMSHAAVLVSIIKLPIVFYYSCLDFVRLKDLFFWVILKSFYYGGIFPDPCHSLSYLIKGPLIFIVVSLSNRFTSYFHSSLC